MSSNFDFTQVLCPDAQANLTRTSLHAFRSCLEDRHRLPARCPPSIRCAAVLRLIPCPTWIFRPLQPRVSVCRLPAERRRSAKKSWQGAADADSDSVPSPRWQGYTPPPRPAICWHQSRCQSLITTSHMPARHVPPLRHSACFLEPPLAPSCLLFANCLFLC